MRVSRVQQRWGAAVALLVGVQAALLQWGVRQSGQPRPIPTVESDVALAVERDDIARPAWQHLPSPVLFALPTAEGFSGEAWLRHRPPAVRETLAEPSPSWLEVPAQETWESLAILQESVQTPAARVADLPVQWRDNFPADSPASRRSTLQVLGPLGSRALLQPPELPSWPSSDVMADSQVQLLVDADGFVQSAVGVEEEGAVGASVFGAVTRSAEADHFAVEIARSLRFSPLPRNAPEGVLGESGGASIGRVVFRWHAVPAVSTNKVSIQPSGGLP